MEVYEAEKATVFGGKGEMKADEYSEFPTLCEGDIENFDNIFETLTSNDFVNDSSHDTFIMSLLKDADLRLSD